MCWAQWWGRQVTFHASTSQNGMEAICMAQRAIVGAGLKARFLCFKYLLAKKPMRTFKSVGHLLSGYKPGLKDP